MLLKFSIKHILVLFLSSFILMAKASMLTPASVKVNTYEYNRYIKPQLKSINSEFFQFLESQNESLKNFFYLYRNFNQIELNLDYWNKNCLKSTEEFCYNILYKIYQQISFLEKSILKTNKNFLADDDKQIRINKNKGDFVFLNYIDLLEQYLFRTSNSFEKFLLNFNLEKNISTWNRYELSKNLDFIFTYYNLLISEFYLYPNKSEFDLFYLNFIKPINKMLIKVDGKNILQKNLRGMDFTINHFYMSASKGNFNITPKEKNLLNTIHRRWNSILKVILN